MVTIAVSLRYHVESDTYYIQVKEARYDRLNTQIKHLTAHLGHIKGEGRDAERTRLEKERRRLVQERRRAQYYVVIPLSDIPENAHIRPIYDMPGHILTAQPERYAELLAGLRAKSQG